MKKIIIEMLVILLCFICCMDICYATTENEKEQTNNIEENEKIEEVPTSIKKDETMYVQERCNIRASYSVDSDRVGGLDAGTEVKVIEEYSNGWYKIQYNEGIAYIKSGILRSTPPIQEENNIQEIPEDEKITSTDTEAINTEAMSVEQTEEENSTQATEQIDDEYMKIMNDIGVLPEVGENIADYLYAGNVCLAISIIIYMKLSNKGEK